MVGDVVKVQEGEHSAMRKEIGPESLKSLDRHPCVADNHGDEPIPAGQPISAGDKACIEILLLAWKLILHQLRKAVTHIAAAHVRWVCNYDRIFTREEIRLPKHPARPSQNIPLEEVEFGLATPLYDWEPIDDFALIRRDQGTKDVGISKLIPERCFPGLIVEGRDQVAQLRRSKRDWL